MASKVPVKSIFIHRAEGPTYDLGQRTIASFEAADEQLRTWARTAPKDGSYNKVDFDVTWTDGETYTGRYDLKHEDSGKANLLGSHIQQHMAFLSGLVCPEHMTTEQHETYLREFGYDKKRDEILAFLQNYEM